MEEKFDAEFKKKVKGINPEVPDIVKSRINDTLASLPAKRSWRKYGHLSAAAALFLICFIGIRYIYPMQLTREKASSASKNTSAAASDAAGGMNKLAGINQYPVQNSTQEKKEDTNGANDKAGENTAVNPETTILKSAAPESAEASYGIAADTRNTEFTMTKDGSTADDNGIQLMLKTAKYDGKEIRVEFDKSSGTNEAAASRAVKDNNAAANVASQKLTQSAETNVAKQYDIRVVVNGIPLKCSINVIETPQAESKYSGTIIIIPDSGLPENFDMVLNFDKIGEVSGQWLLTAHVLKQ